MAVKKEAKTNSTATRRRERCSEKERKRNTEINDAFQILQGHLPVGIKTPKLPRIKTLRLAVRYIEHLNSILRGDQYVDYNNMCTRPVTMSDFDSIALVEMQVRNSYSERILQEEMGQYSPPTTSSPPEGFYSQQMPVNSSPQEGFYSHPIQYQDYPQLPTEQLQEEEKEEPLEQL